MPLQEICLNDWGLGAIGVDGSEVSGARTSKKLTGSATVNRVFGNEVGPAVELATTSASQTQEGVWYTGDDLIFDIDQLHSFDWLFYISTALGSSTTVHMGLAGAYAADEDTIADSILYSVGNSLALNFESDDDSNEIAPTAVGVTLEASKWYRMGFEFMRNPEGKAKIVAKASRVGSGKIFTKNTFDGLQYDRVLEDTTINMSNHAGGLQPYFVIDKGSTDVGTVLIAKATARVLTA